mgnify:CR=1 FL=1
MPLNLADINTDYIIQKICGNENERHHLETLGFLEGATVRILSILFGSYIVRQDRHQSGICQNDHRANLKYSAILSVNNKEIYLIYEKRKKCTSSL